MLNGLEANSPLAERNHKLHSAITFCTKNIQFKIYVGQNFFILLPKNFSKKILFYIVIFLFLERNANELIY